MTLSAQDATEQRQKKHVRDRWLLSAPALALIIAASVGPLLIVVLYSFLAPGSYGDVKWEFSTEGWFNVLFTRDIFDDTVSLADAHFSIFWRSIKLAFATVISSGEPIDTPATLMSRPPSSRSTATGPISSSSARLATHPSASCSLAKRSPPSAEGWARGAASSTSVDAAVQPIMNAAASRGAARYVRRGLLARSL